MRTFNASLNFNRHILSLNVLNGAIVIILAIHHHVYVDGINSTLQDKGSRVREIGYIRFTWGFQHNSGAAKFQSKMGLW